MRALPLFLPALLAPLAAQGLKPGDPLPTFALPATDGSTLDSKALKGPVLVVFLSTQCPYVKASEARINALATAYAGRVAVVGINSNESESEARREEGLAGMKARAEAQGYAFPYLKDEDQSVIKAFGGLCTPDFFLFDGAGKLAYHGRLDDGGGREEAVTRQDLREAVEAVLAGRAPAGEAKPSRGCSIKWKG